MNGPDYAARAAAGAAFLDEELPGWAERIDLDRLALIDECDCILGQLGGNYQDMRHNLRMDQAGAAGLGFTLHDAESTHDWDQLDAAWADEVRKRREAAQVTP